jgi:SAM-dependent methyltransferase
MSRTRKFPTAENAQDRRNLGAVYTPLWMARYIVDRSIAAARAGNVLSSRILDPACGDGIFLQATFERLLLGCEQSQAKPLQFEQRLSLVQDHVFGVDLDKQAVAAARRRLAQLILQVDSSEVDHEDANVERVAQSLSGNIVHGNALLAASDAAIHGEPFAIDWNAQFPQASATGGFDVVVGNPPYVNIRRISQTYGELARDYLKANFKTATGNFDLYVLFIELASRLLRRGGTAGLIVPNKIGTLKYARACREMLLRETAVLQIGDVSRADVFRCTGVYPYIVIWRNEEPDVSHAIEIVEASSQRELIAATPRLITQRNLEAESGFAIHGQLDLESGVATKPLGQLCRLHSGTTGFAAQKIAAALVELESYTDDAFPFVVTGNIDRYRIDLGQVRYMKRKFEDPGLPHQCQDYSENKRRLYSNP